MEWCGEVHRVLNERGAFFLNVGAALSNPMFPHEVVLALSELFSHQNTFHWVKSITVETRAGEEISVGHFKPISSRRFVNDCHEYVSHLSMHGDMPPARLAAGFGYVEKSNIAG